MTHSPVSDHYVGRVARAFNKLELLCRSHDSPEDENQTDLEFSVGQLCDGDARNMRRTTTDNSGTTEFVSDISIPRDHA